MSLESDLYRISRRDGRDDILGRIGFSDVAEISTIENICSVSSLDTYSSLDGKYSLRNRKSHRIMLHGLSREKKDTHTHTLGRSTHRHKTLYLYIGASALGVSLANNTTMRVLDLSYANLSLLGLRDLSMGLRRSTSLMGLLVEGHDWSSTKFMVRPPPNITALSKTDAYQYAAKCILTAMHMNPHLPLMKLTGVNLGFSADITPMTMIDFGLPHNTPLEMATSQMICALNERVLEYLRSQRSSQNTVDPHSHILNPAQTRTTNMEEQKEDQPLQKVRDYHHPQQHPVATSKTDLVLWTESKKVLDEIACKLTFDANELRALCHYYCPGLFSLTLEVEAREEEKDYEGDDHENDRDDDDSIGRPPRSKRQRLEKVEIPATNITHASSTTSSSLSSSLSSSSSSRLAHYPQVEVSMISVHK